MTDLSPEDVFPTGGPIEESDQIGRQGTIQALTDRALEGSDTLLLQPRQIGKTSVARAALKHVRAEHSGVTAEVDCTSADISDGPSLARALLKALRDAGGEVSRGLSTRDAAAKPKGIIDRLRSASARAAEAGLAEAQITGPLLDLLGVEAPSLDDVLEELARLGDSAPTTIFVDEIQEIAKWADRDAVEAALRRFLRRGERRVALIAAGSDRKAAEELFAVGRPLEWEFQPFGVPEIDEVEWHQGIVERFTRVGIRISADRVRQILDETGGQPWKTMLIAKETLREARGAGEEEGSWTSVDAAIAQARRHPSWNE